MIEIPIERRDGLIRVIRCKDCKFYHKEWDGTETHYYSDYWCEWVEPSEDDYCSLAERRKDV